MGQTYRINPMTGEKTLRESTSRRLCRWQSRRAGDDFAVDAIPVVRDGLRITDPMRPRVRLGRLRREIRGDEAWAEIIRKLMG